MRGVEPAALVAVALASDAREDFAARVHDCDAGAEVGSDVVRGDAAEVFADVHEVAPAAPINAYRRRARQVDPLGFVLPLRAEYLDAVVFAVGDVNPSVAVGGDVVDYVELALAGAGLPPRKEVAAVRVVFVDAGVGVAVRDVELAVALVDGDMGGAAERLAAHARRRAVRDAEREQDFAVRRELAYRAVAVVDAE